MISSNMQALLACLKPIFLKVSVFKVATLSGFEIDKLVLHWRDLFPVNLTLMVRNIKATNGVVLRRGFLLMEQAEIAHHTKHDS